MESENPESTKIGVGRSQSFSSQKSDDSHTAAEYVPEPDVIELKANLNSQLYQFSIAT